MELKPNIANHKSIITMSPQANKIFLSIQQLDLAISEKRMYHIEFIKLHGPLLLTREIYSQINELERQKKELKIQLSHAMGYGEPSA